VPIVLRADQTHLPLAGRPARTAWPPVRGDRLDAFTTRCSPLGRRCWWSRWRFRALSRADRQSCGGSSRFGLLYRDLILHLAATRLLSGRMSPGHAPRCDHLVCSSSSSSSISTLLFLFTVFRFSLPPLSSPEPASDVGDERFRTWATVFMSTTGRPTALGASRVAD